MTGEGASPETITLPEVSEPYEVTCTVGQVLSPQATLPEEIQSNPERGQVSENAGDLAFDGLVVRALESLGLSS